MTSCGGLSEAYQGRRHFLRLASFNSTSGVRGSCQVLDQVRQPTQHRIPYPIRVKSIRGEYEVQGSRFPTYVTRSSDLYAGVKLLNPLLLAFYFRSILLLLTLTATSDLQCDSRSLEHFWIAHISGPKNEILSTCARAHGRYASSKTGAASL